MWKSKNTMMVGYRQQFINSCLNPSAPGDIIAFGAVTIPAGVISFFQMTAGITNIPVGAKFTTPAMLNVVHDLVLPGMQPMCCPELLTMFPEDVTNCRG